MKQIVLFGAGLSCTTLIKYLVENAAVNNWNILIATTTTEKADRKIGNSPHASSYKIDAINEHEKRQELIKDADLVISMLPASFHPIVANDCITFKTHLVTASYVSDEMKALHEKATAAGIILMNEMGVDPGIDHMSAMQIIDEIKDAGGTINNFKSYCGGLMAPGYDNNPWNYKFTWNPRNVVVAGKAGATFLENSGVKMIDYIDLFKQTETIEIPGFGAFESYGNRDSIPYRSLYKINKASGIYRATLRRPGFSKAWDILIQLGFTDEEKNYPRTEETFADFTKQLISNFNGDFKSSIEQQLTIQISDKTFDQIAWLGLFSNDYLSKNYNTAAEVLQIAMQQKMMIEDGDKDMLAMQHVFNYTIDMKTYKKVSSMVFIGDGNEHTAMSQTVGLPVGIVTKLILNETIQRTGVHIPTHKDIYEPVLSELKKFNVNFTESEEEINQEEFSI